MNKKTALAGNPNSGKTTLFNILTGGNEYTGNRAGVTVGVKKGKIKEPGFELCDLPGIYSLNGYSKEEKIAVSYIASEKPDVIINVLDGTNLSRGLYLTLQLLKLNLPVMAVINMKDECERRNIKINTKGLSAELGINFLFVSSKKEDGIEEITENLSLPQGMDISAYDRLMAKLSETEKGFESEERDIVKANALYYYADELCRKYVTEEKRTGDFTKYADRILLNKYLSYPIMFTVVFSGFFLAFGQFGRFLSSLILKAADFILFTPIYRISAFFGNDIRQFITDGVLAGAESVAGFLPYVFILFFYTAVLEECGYMSRIAFISDRFMKRFGLSGKSVIPFVLGFGCSVPAILSARIIRSDEERDRTICLVPFMACSAKIPAAVLLCSLFFKSNYIYPLAFLYFTGVLSAFIVGLIISGKKRRRESFILEMPPYRIPDFKSICVSVVWKMKDLVVRIGITVIFFSAVMWVLSNYNFAFCKVSAENSILGSIGKIAAPLFAPLGFGFYQASVSLVSGIAAKEGICAGLSVLCGGYGNIENYFTPASALSFLTFVFLYLPCFSSFITLLRELKDKRKVFASLFFHTVFAYLMSFVVYRTALLLL